MTEHIQRYISFEITEIKKLVGYDNANYLLKSDTEKYIFKTYVIDEGVLDLIKAENDALLHLQKTQPKAFPKPVPFVDGSFIKIVPIDGVEKVCRVLSFLEGSFLGDVEHTPELFKSLGSFLAHLNTDLSSFKNYVIQSRKWEWDIQYLALNKKYIDDITEVKNRNIVSYFFQQFEENVSPVLPELRKSIIHNDANEWNVLVQGGKISGLIDFGDLTHSPLINELAVAITYAVYDKENPIEWISLILSTYNKTLPLQERELEILYYLIAAQLCISVCNSAHAKKNNPENIYASVSEKSAWETLHKWIRINPIHAKNVFFEACGFSVSTPKSIEEVIKRRHTSLSPILSLSYQTPIHMTRSVFQYMYDVEGNTFLDAYNNIPHVGHAHPQVVEAGQRQMAKLNTNTRYAYDLLAEYAEKLLSKFPDSLKKVFFVNSGSAASDLAIRLAYAHTKHQKLMVMEHGYHGNTQLSIDISDYKFSNKKGPGKKSYILKTPIPDTYKGFYTNNDGSAGFQYAQDAIKEIQESKLPIAAFISEPVVGCGGQVPLAKGYLKEIYPAIRKQGGVCISDEVQTGFGRLGDHFWGFEAQEVVPDIVILGKPMGNGHPMGAVVTTDEIANSFSKGVEFFSSFGGNPVSCAIGLSLLNVIEKEQLQENAKKVGDYYKSLLSALRNKYDCIGDVRGSGLFLGVEIVKPDSIEPDTELAHHLKNQLRNRHILISTDGPHDSVLKSKPPLCFTKENAEEVVGMMDQILSQYYEVS